MSESKKHIIKSVRPHKCIPGLCNMREDHKGTMEIDSDDFLKACSLTPRPKDLKTDRHLPPD